MAREPNRILGKTLLPYIYTAAYSEEKRGVTLNQDMWRCILMSTLWNNMGKSHIYGKSLKKNPFVIYLNIFLIYQLLISIPLSNADKHKMLLISNIYKKKKNLSGWFNC